MKNNLTQRSKTPFPAAGASNTNVDPPPNVDADHLLGCSRQSNLRLTDPAVTDALLRGLSALHLKAANAGGVCVKTIGVVCEMQKLIFNNADVNVTMCQRRICAELWCTLFTTHVVLWSGRVYLSRTTAYADVHHVLLCYEEADVHHVLLCYEEGWLLCVCQRVWEDRFGLCDQRRDFVGIAGAILILEGKDVRGHS